MIADHGGELKAVEFRHAHVNEDDGGLVLQQELERLARRRCLDQIFAEIAKNLLAGEKFRRLIVDQEDIDFFEHKTGLAMEPHSQRRQ